MSKTNPITQARILKVLDKLAARCEGSPIAHQILLVARANCLPMTRSEELESYRRMINLNSKYQKLCEVFIGRAKKVANIQSRQSISGVIWDYADPSGRSQTLSFPVFHHLLNPTEGDKILLASFKPIVIEYAIKWAIENGLTFSRTNLEGDTLRIDALDIWAIAPFYDWATIYLENIPNNPVEIFLCLGKQGAIEEDISTMWIYAR